MAVRGLFRRHRIVTIVYDLLVGDSSLTLAARRPHEDPLREAMRTVIWLRRNST